VSSPNPHAIDADTLSGMKPLRRVVLSLGSNLGDRLANLQGGTDAIKDTPDVIVVDISSVYETEPVDAPEGSGPFLNMVIVAETTLEPQTLLERAQAIEDAFGRERSNDNAPRTLDVDLVMVNGATVDRPELQLPHPRAHQRAFVLVPWHEVDPQAELPGYGTISELLDVVGTAGVELRGDLEIAGD
jgi:2-amino-4-hydroxy-6-hydroxymethyldihydropteridine diphosphokinase